MIKRMFVFMLCTCLLMVQVQASTQDGLRTAFEELNYSLTVDWDGKDQAFYENQLKSFVQKIKDLQGQGLTHQQMIDFTKSQIKDAQVVKDLETVFSVVISNKMSSEEASRFMLDSMKRTYRQGASWNGDSVLYLTAGILIVALAVAVSMSRTNGSYNTGGGCYDDCYYYDFQCGYDYWGPIWCDRYTCETYCY